LSQYSYGSLKIFEVFIAAVAVMMVKASCATSHAAFHHTTVTKIPNKRLKICE
jgi:hypothetical protein